LNLLDMDFLLDKDNDSSPLVLHLVNGGLYRDYDNVF
jgi:hypothetical protein